MSFGYSSVHDMAILAPSADKITKICCVFSVFGSCRVNIYTVSAIPSSREGLKLFVVILFRPSCDNRMFAKPFVSRSFMTDGGSIIIGNTTVSRT